MLAIYFIFGFVLFLFGCLLFDDLLKCQVERFPESWIKDGRPRGFSFKPSGSSYISMWRLTNRGFSTVPSWAKSDKVALKRYIRLRIFSKLWKWYVMLVVPVVLITAIT